MRKRGVQGAGFPKILLYHRVEDMGNDPQRMCVGRDHFDEHLSVLRENFRPVRLSSGFDNARHSDEDRQVAITFDDGYADNLLNAKPLLEAHGVPATVFITTDCIDSKREFWWDELERILLLPGDLPNILKIRVDNHLLSWNLGRDASYPPTRWTDHGNWTLGDTGDPTARHTLYRALLELLRERRDSSRQAVLEQLRSAANVPPEGRSSHRTLTAPELRELASGGLIEVGAHTRTHPVLASLSISEQWKEIAGSARRLKELIGRNVSSFAYPYGWHGQYTRATVTLVRGTRFARACSGFPPSVARSSNRFELPRLVVRDCDGDTFARDVIGRG
jgi:peptidoglycan/xylan/chitin deacetylase (PgdA/CDA1 family)